MSVINIAPKSVAAMEIETKTGTATVTETATPTAALCPYDTATFLYQVRPRNGIYYECFTFFK